MQFCSVYRFAKNGFLKKKESEKIFAVAGDRTRVTRVTGGNTYHYTTTTCRYQLFPKDSSKHFCLGIKPIL